MAAGSSCIFTIDMKAFNFHFQLSAKIHITQKLRTIALNVSLEEVISSNFMFSLPSVYQPDLWWPPRILTANSKVTKVHDGHSSVRRQILYKHPMKSKLCSGSHRTTGGFFSQCSLKKKNQQLCTYSNFACIRTWQSI